VTSAETFAASCDAILTHGLRNITVSQGSEALVSTQYFNHCQKNFDQMSDNVMAQAAVEVFGYGSGSAGFNRQQTREKLEQWCTDNRSVAQQNRNSFQMSQTFYQGAVSAWESCVRLDSKDITINPIISPDGRTVDIGVVYRGSTRSGVMFTGLVTEGFECAVTTPDGKRISYPREIGPQAAQIRCKRASPTQQNLNGVPYNVLPRGTIGIQTASDPFQLFFAEEWNPPAPLDEVKRLEAALRQAELPIGTVVASVLTPEQFFNPVNMTIRAEAWVPVDGKPLPSGSKYGSMTGTTNAPNREDVEGLQVKQVVSGSRSHGENVKEFEKPNTAWKWVASGRDVQGQAPNNDWEQDVDQMQTWVDDNGVVTAQGRTFNRKHGQWGAWKGGTANVFGVATGPSKLNYYLKIN
jgi:hypothetical protein